MSKPKKYRAYQPVKKTDGFHRWVEHSFDLTVKGTPDDLEMMKAVWMAGGPRERMAAIQAKLDSLREATPAMQIHADAIQTILARLSDHELPFARQEMAELAEAERLWDYIVLLRDVRPKAVMGEAHSKEQSKKARLPRGGIIAGIKEKLDKRYPDHTATELWPHLFHELREEGLHPKDVPGKEPGKEQYIYDHFDGRKIRRKPISFGRFANIKVKK